LDEIKRCDAYSWLVGVRLTSLSITLYADSAEEQMRWQSTQKDGWEFPLDMKTIKIKHPQIIYPNRPADVSEIGIDRSKGVITLYRQNCLIETWQLKPDCSMHGL